MLALSLLETIGAETDDSVGFVEVEDKVDGGNDPAIGVDCVDGSAGDRSTMVPRNVTKPCWALFPLLSS